jgi:transcriptional regulator with XRE-family HTH domain
MSVLEPDLLERLIAIRKWRGLTQRQVSARMFLTHPVLSMVERRKRPARLDFLESYARAVGAELGVWPVAFPEPVEVKRPPGLACISLITTKAPK